MKYKILIQVLALALTLSSCKKNTNVVALNPELSVNATELTFSEKDSTATILITTNVADYEVSIPSSSAWCSYQKNGKNLVIKVAAMTSATTQRNGIVTITVVSGSQQAKKNIIVTQKRVWKLVWEDNFDTDGAVNSAKWTLVNKSTSDWNKYMTPTNDMAFVKDGNLVLKGIKTATGYQTSGVDSRNKFSIKYGKVEVRARLSAGQGTWPAIWMMPQQSVYGGWPKSGEIDIMEHLNNDTKIHQTAHSHYTYNLGSKTDPPHTASPAFTVGGYNTFGIEWFPDKIDFLLNGNVTFSYPKKPNAPADQFQYPFDQPFYIILNQALGGAWVGTINDAILPVQTEIDYVKVYGLSVY